MKSVVDDGWVFCCETAVSLLPEATPSKGFNVCGGGAIMNFKALNHALNEGVGATLVLAFGMGN